MQTFLSTSLPYDTMEPQFFDVISTRSCVEPDYEHPYPPPILVKNAIWYLPDDPDLFISIRRLLYGLHQRFIIPYSPFFANTITTTQNNEENPRGLTPSLPIPLDKEETLGFEEFLILLYYPTRFHADEARWFRIYKFAGQWNFPEILQHAWLEPVLYLPPHIPSGS